MATRTSPINEKQECNKHKQTITKFGGATLTHHVSSGRSCVPLSQPDCTELPGERPTVGRHGRLAETTAIGDDSEAACASHTTTNDRRPRLRRCCTARVELSARRHRFCTVIGHFQAVLKDSSVWTIVRLTTDLVTKSTVYLYFFIILANKVACLLACLPVLEPLLTAG